MINLTHIDLKNKKLRVISFKRISRNVNEHPLADSSIFTIDQNDELIHSPNLEYVMCFNIYSFLI